MTLTPAQKKVKTCIDQWKARYKYSPTQQEIGEQLVISRQAVAKHLKALEAKGAIKRDVGRSRSVR